MLYRQVPLLATPQVERPSFLGEQADPAQTPQVGRPGSLDQDAYAMMNRHWETLQTKLFHETAEKEGLQKLVEQLILQNQDLSLRVQGMEVRLKQEADRKASSPGSSSFQDPSQEAADHQRQAAPRQEAAQGQEAEESQREVLRSQQAQDPQREARRSQEAADPQRDVPGPPGIGSSRVPDYGVPPLGLKPRLVRRLHQTPNSRLQVKRDLLKEVAHKLKLEAQHQGRARRKSLSSLWL